MSLIKSKTCVYRIGVSEVLLTPLFIMNVAPPSTSQYKGFSKEEIESDGGGLQHGYKTVELTWINPSAMSVFQIKKQVEGGLLTANRELYLTIPFNDGQTIASRTFYNIYGKVRPLEIHESGNIAGRGMVYQSLTLRLNAVIILGVA